MLNEKGEPTSIAGVPPDYFSPTGQRWGNPLYRWDVLESTNFDFWVDRLTYNATLFDVIRIDHFRAFDTYWKIPSSCPTAVEGEWIEAPGQALFNTLQKKLPKLNIIAEDLGDLRPEVLQLRDDFKLPGMKIMQFELPIYPPFDPNLMKQDSFPERFVVYSGTHDNQTVMGWYAQLAHDSKTHLHEYLKPFEGTIAQQMVQLTLQHPSYLAILPMQDVLSLDDEARMNTPGTIGTPNWEWKMINFDSFEAIIDKLKGWIKVSNR
jgi:4-alpha-glucanotransferase